MDESRFNLKQAMRASPQLLMSDLKYVTRNGKIEQGKSPFNEHDFIRLEGSSVKDGNKPYLGNRNAINARSRTI